jgi:hypothetical protein
MSFIQVLKPLLPRLNDVFRSRFKNERISACVGGVTGWFLRRLGRSRSVSPSAGAVGVGGEVGVVSPGIFNGGSCPWHCCSTTRPNASIPSSAFASG